MGAITELFYPLPDYRRTTMSTLVWWESRRLAYNVVVGSTGLVTLGVVALFASLPPHASGLGVAAWRGVVAYGVLANVCYSMGWLAELAMLRLWGPRAPDAGPLLFRQGLIFATGLTLLPAFLMTGAWFVRLALWLLH